MLTGTPISKYKVTGGIAYLDTASAQTLWCGCAGPLNEIFNVGFLTESLIVSIFDTLVIGVPVQACV